MCTANTVDKPYCAQYPAQYCNTYNGWRDLCPIKCGKCTGKWPLLHVPKDLRYATGLVANLHNKLSELDSNRITMLGKVSTTETLQVMSKGI